MYIISEQHAFILKHACCCYNLSLNTSSVLQIAAMIMFPCFPFKKILKINVTMPPKNLILLLLLHEDIL